MVSKQSTYGNVKLLGFPGGFRKFIFHTEIHTYETYKLKVLGRLSWHGQRQVVQTKSFENMEM